MASYSRVMHRRLHRCDRLVGLAGHCGDHHRDVVAGVDLAFHMARDVADTVDIGDGCAAGISSPGGP